MSATASRQQGRQRRHRRVRQRVVGSAQRPRLSVFRTSRHIYAQLVDDAAQITLGAASTVEPELRASTLDRTAKAAEVGRRIARVASARGIKAVVFDRGGYLYHGRLKALADGARESGLDF